MEKETQQKFELAEERYQKNRVQLEQRLDELSDEQRQFQHYLESIPDRMNIISGHYDDSQLDRSTIYRLLEQANEDLHQVTRNVKNKLEDCLDENQALYNRQIQVYEEERQVKKEGEAHA